MKTCRFLVPKNVIADMVSPPVATTQKRVVQVWHAKWIPTMYARTHTFPSASPEQRQAFYRSRPPPGWLSSAQRRSNALLLDWHGRGSFFAGWGRATVLVVWSKRRSACACLEEKSFEQGLKDSRLRFRPSSSGTGVTGARVTRHTAARRVDSDRDSQCSSWRWRRSAQRYGDEAIVWSADRSLALRVDEGGGEKKIAPTATKKKLSFFLWLLVQFFFTAPLSTTRALWERGGRSTGGPDAPGAITRRSLIKFHFDRYCLFVC